MKKLLRSLMAIAMLIFSTGLTGQPNGKNVNYARYGNAQKTMGRFEQTGPGKWVEIGADGRKNFIELSRDEWSVYLHDGSRNMKIQLDLFRKEVIVEYDGPGKRKLYDLTKAESAFNAGDVKGLDASYASYGTGGTVTGRFEERSPGIWYETNSANSKIKFNEVARDEWSVYLNDPTRNMKIQLDLFRKEVIVEYDGPGKRKLYDLYRAESPFTTGQVSGRNATYVGYGSNKQSMSGRFENTGNKNWVEINSGNQRSNFIELSRDDWSVYLFDASRSMKIQLDLFLKQVFVEYDGPGKRKIYDVVRAEPSSM